MTVENSQPLATFVEIEGLLNKLPQGDEAAARTAEKNLPAGSDKLGAYAIWLARWQGKAQPQLRHPRIALFAATHPPDPQIAETQNLVQSCQDGTLLINKLAAVIDCDLRVYELDLEQPNSLPMQEDDCTRAIAYGMMAVEPGVQLLCIGDLSPSAKNADIPEKTALQTLQNFGGFDSAAIVGAILAARLAQVPVVLSGVAARLAYTLLQNYNAGIVEHCILCTLDDVSWIDDERAQAAELIPVLRLAAGLLN